MDDMIVTTGDIREDYEIIGPIYFQVSNKGVFGSALSRLVSQYQEKIKKIRMGMRDDDRIREGAGRKTCK